MFVSQTSAMGCLSCLPNESRGIPNRGEPRPGTRGQYHVTLADVATPETRRWCAAGRIDSVARRRGNERVAGGWVEASGLPAFDFGILAAPGPRAMVCCNPRA